MRKLLFIGVGFYNYDNYIANELKKDYDISYLNSKGFEQSHRFFSYLCIKLGLSRLLSYMQRQFIKSQLDSLIDKVYDIVFVIKGENLEAGQLSNLRKRNPQAKFVLYLWDSFARHKNLDVITPFFDKKYSFDSQDCKKSSFKLRPLFYFDEVIKHIAIKNIPISFVGGDHTIRYTIVKRLKRICKANDIDYSFHLFIGKIQSFKLKYVPFFCKYDKKDFDVLSTKQLSYSKYVDLIGRSKVVLDIANTGQTGLTMRTIESLAMGAKLLTTNKYIRDYKDIPSNSYLILDENTSDKMIASFIQDERTDYDFPSRYSYKFALKEMLQ